MRADQHISELYTRGEVRLVGNVERTSQFSETILRRSFSCHFQDSQGYSHVSSPFPVVYPSHHHSGVRSTRHPRLSMQGGVHIAELKPCPTSFREKRTPAFRVNVP